MLLKYLKIEKDNEIIRYIPFKKGVNLIVDTTTNLSNQKESGNNVGKTTVLRLVDYCLGGKVDPIYKDFEFKSLNSKVQSFLEKNNIIITLCLGTSFENNENDIILRKNFLKRTQKISEINGKNYTNTKDYVYELKKILFSSTSEKPTFRELISRNIRCDALRMDKVINYLGSFASSQTYEGIYFYLFGKEDETELSAEKNKLNTNIKFNENIIKNTFKGKTSAMIKQHLLVLENDLGSINTEKINFNINPNYNAEFNELNKIKNEISIISSKLAAQKLKLSLLKESLKEIESNNTTVNAELVAQVYKEAKLYIPNLQKSFENALTFHNKLVNNKIVFISEDMPKLKKEIEHSSLLLEEYLRKEKCINQNLIKNGSLSDYEAIVAKANQKYEEKGQLRKELEKIEELERNIAVDLDRIEKINENIENAAELINKNIEIFNEFFSSYSSKFYNENFVLSQDLDKKNNVHKFIISNLLGSIGAGKKKGIIAAFDLAYISYSNKKNIINPKFILHDRIEGIHGNQLKSLLDTVNSEDFRGQYIASVLSGKFSEEQLGNQYLEENTVIQLSQNDKLFKIEEQLQKEESEITPQAIKFPSMDTIEKLLKESAKEPADEDTEDFLF